MPLLNLKNAFKKYGKGENVVNALNGADLTLESGEVAIILGASGSGKSTMLNILGGIDTLSEGEFTFMDEKISGKNDKELLLYRRKDIGFVFQFYNLIGDLTVKENIRVVAEYCENPLNIDEVMETLGISALADRFPSQLSGGQQQRVAIARAVIKNPRLLLCDELTGALDSKSSADVLQFIEKINREYNTTIVIITHNEEISKMGDRIIRIKDGKVIYNEKNQNKLSAEQLEL
ncbi:MAG: ABC transporter ATP-binding protein [Ruminococcus flavefaciens]|nr:ABC transporter ATP-binding protein [Ruminococcus flavefaciens]